MDCLNGNVRRRGGQGQRTKVYGQRITAANVGKLDEGQRQVVQNTTKLRDLQVGFVSGPDFSRAVQSGNYHRLQPLWEWDKN